ncbi:MAG: GNAT family N-acetyltransferase [Candidatus Cloacimonetes bacterium]|nr:GNAT family N-acetyltransferase [Candidatus Cloacimonadota bacterium]
MSITYSHQLPPISAYFDLFSTTGWNRDYQSTARDLETALQHSQFLVCAYQEGRLIGFGRIVDDGVLHAMVYDLIAHPDFQKRGIGSNILEKLLAYCLQKNIRDIQLFAAADRMEFYKKHGFQPRPDNAPGMELIKNQIMRRINVQS